MKYWLSNLPEGTPIEDLVRLGKMRWRMSMTTASSRTPSGSITSRAAATVGCNHHVTLVSVAHAFLTLERRRRDRRPPLRAAA